MLFRKCISEIFWSYSCRRSIQDIYCTALSFELWYLHRYSIFIKILFYYIWDSDILKLWNIFKACSWSHQIMKNKSIYPCTSDFLSGTQYALLRRHNHSNHKPGVGCPRMGWRTEARGYMGTAPHRLVVDLYF